MRTDTDSIDMIEPDMQLVVWLEKAKNKDIKKIDSMLEYINFYFLDDSMSEIKERLLKLKEEENAKRVRESIGDSK